MLNNAIDFIKGARGSSQTRLVVLVTAALTIIGVAIFAAQPWGGSDTAQAEDPPRICDFFPDYFLCEPTETLTPSNTPTITNTPTDTQTPTNTLTPTLTPTFIPKLTSTGPPKAIIGGGTGGELLVPGSLRNVPMFNTGVHFHRAPAQQAMPSDGTVTHLFVTLDGSAANTCCDESYNFYVANYSNLNISTVFCAITGSDTTCADRSRCRDFQAGDLIALQSSPTNNVNARAMSWTAIFTPNATCPPDNP